MSYLHHVEFSDCIRCYPPFPRLSRATLQFLDYHVLPSSSQTVSRALLQFPGCITCYPPVPRLHHVLSSSSLAVSRATHSSQTVSRALIQFPGCITCYPQFSDYITCYPRVNKMYHAPPLATLGEKHYLYFNRLLLLLISHQAPTFRHDYTAC